MFTDRLKLYKPNVDIYFKVTFNIIINNLKPYGFKVYKNDYCRNICGEAWINKEDKVIINLYFDDVDRLDSIMILGIRKYNEEEIINSYHRKQEWLEKSYGKPNDSKENFSYNIKDYTWNLDGCTIEHFIKDRFGDEEGVYFNIAY